jgi:tRNA threonylcarbamoyl adenosine modification protein YeaZ
MSAPAGAHDGRRRPLVIIDTATAWVVVGTANRDGRLDAASTWPAGHRHGETLLPALGRFLGEQNVRRSRLPGVVVGTGPGAFTGLRVGIASAKGIAVGVGIPIIGIPTGEALLFAAEAAGIGAAGELTLLLPAGPSDRVAVRLGQPARLIPAGTEPEAEPSSLVAVDLEGRAEDAAAERGTRARQAFPAALARLGAARLAQRPEGDAVARLVPEYVTLPRGVLSPPGDDVTLSVG